jgi:hypothetical protein
MSSNFIKTQKNNPEKTKGIAVRITSELYEKIKQQDISRNELIIKALTKYFNNGFEKHDDIPTEVYEEIYSTLHNTEITPLKKQLNHAEKTITLLQSQNIELKKDKQFLMNHCTNLIETFQSQKKPSFWKRKGKQKEE